MTLVDTSVWIDHLRKGDPTLETLLQEDRVLAHPFVTGELAMVNLKHRGRILSASQDLPKAAIATDDEVLQFIAQRSLFGRGIGYLDAHLLAAVKLTPEATLWTRDKRLAGVAESIHLAFLPRT